MGGLISNPRETSMNLRSSLILIAGGLALLGCDDPAPTSIAGGTADGGSGPDGSGGVVAPDGDVAPDGEVVPVDATPLDASPPAPDLGPDTSRDNVPPPTNRLVAGYSERALGFPVGIGTVGYAPGTGAKTPFASLYPGTNAQHTDLTARAVVLRNGGEAVVLLRTDSVGIWQDMVRDVRVRLREEGRGDLADGLIIGATHTHSSGGRIFDHFVGEVAVGPFLPGLYQRVRDAIVDAVLAADGNAEDAAVGHTVLQVPQLHHDRRCENGDVQDDAMGIIKIERANGELLALVVNYAMHGTVLDSDEWTLSRDASGAVEAGIESRLPVPAPVLYLQSWAGDMAPSRPDGYIVADGHPSRPGFPRLDALGAAAADAVIPQLDDIEVTETPTLRVSTVAVPLVPEEINPDGSFDAYRFGGIYCVDSDSNCGPDAQPYTPAQLACVPIAEMWTVNWAYLTAARIGDLGLMTLPGEPLTSVGVELRERTLEATGLRDVFVIGYSQGYLAYLLHPDDFWMGGYEAAGTLMGPGFAVFLINRAVAIAANLVAEQPLGFTPAAVAGGPSLQYDPLEAEAPQLEPVVDGQSAAGENTVWVRWVGGGPVTDAPRVSLEHQVDDEWIPFVYPHGGPVHSGGPEIELLLSVEPTYEDVLVLEARTFRWTARMPSRFSVMPSFGQPEGMFRFVIEGHHQAPYELVSAPFALGGD